MILLPFNPAPDFSGSRLNGESGFPHSEICGSKVAHTSPQLIAACHVLHRLCMPRHPPNALTSRLRVHTTNDRIAPVVRSADNLLSIDNRFAIAFDLRLRRKPTPPRHRFLEPIHNVKDGASAPDRGCPRIRLSSSLENDLPHTARRPAGSWWSLSGSNR